MKYIVKDTQIMHGVGQESRTYGPGDEIELTEKEAATLGASVEPVIDEADVTRMRIEMGLTTIAPDEEDAPADDKKRRKR